MDRAKPMISDGRAIGATTAPGDPPDAERIQGEPPVPSPKASPPPAFTETELKLAAAPEAVDRLRRCGLVRQLALGPEETAALTSIYYDTQDRALRKQKAVLRVRHDSDRVVQTLKASRASALDRSEWDAPAAGSEPDTKAFTHPEALALVTGIGVSDLSPLFTTRITRMTRMVRPEGEASVEDVVALVFDHGDVVAGSATAPISEIELELHHGARAGLYDLGLALHDIEPLSVETLTKAARGFILAGETRPTWSGADIPKLAADATADQAFAAILTSCFNHWMANQAAGLDGADPEGVHQLRVALRRLRAILSVFGKVSPGPRLAWLRREAKWLAGSLGPARDWDVFLGELLPIAAPALDDGGDYAVLEQAATIEQRAGYEHARTEIRSPRATTFLLTLGGWIEGRRWRDEAVSGTAAEALFARPMVELAGAVLAKRHRRALKHGRRFAKLDSAARHQLRIALKTLRYPAEFFRSLYPRKAGKRYMKVLKGLQDGLGHLNDVATTSRLLDRLVDDAANGRIALPEAGQARLSAASEAVLSLHRKTLDDYESTLVRDWKRFRRTSGFWQEPETGRPLAEGG